TLCYLGWWGGSRQGRFSFPVPRDRAGEPVLEVDLRLDTEQPPRLVDVGDPDLHVGVVERTKHDLAVRPREPLDPLRQVENRHRRARVADVERLADRHL